MPGWLRAPYRRKALTVTLDEVLGRLEGVRRSSPTKALALCPAHLDQKQSLSIACGDDGRILIHCHAGCELDHVLAALRLTKNDLFPARENSTAEYDYTDPEGTLLFQVVRRPGKKFTQRRPDGKGGWIRNLEGVSRVPYRLPELVGADPARPVFVVEGEKDADNLHRLGEIATTNPGGTGGGKVWNSTRFREPLRDREVVILPDNDEPGQKHAERVAQALHGCAGLVKVLALPGLSEKGDVSDWLQAGGTRDRLYALIDAVKPWKPSEQAQEAAGDEREAERPTQARLLVGLAQEHAELFKTADGEAYATIRGGETLAIRSKGFRSILLQKFFATFDKTPSSQGLKEATDTLEALAQLGSATRTAFLRTGAQDERLFLDLGDSTRKIVEIDRTGWRLISAADAEVRFRRTSSMRPLPVPIIGGDLNDLRRFLNTRDEEWRWRLLLVWLLFTFQPCGPFPVLVLQGEQGCAKSTTARVLRALIDPSQTTLRLPPRDEDKLLVSAKSSWVLAFDNLSGMPAWLSDCLCCLATGTAQSKRALYTDDEEYIIEATRPVIVNGIDDMTARPDFASRALAIELPQIRDEHRQEESEFWAEFARVQPAILGTLLSTLSKILAVLPEVRLSVKPRMADFARFGVAAERVLGWPAGAFLGAYQTSQADSAAVTLDSNLVAQAVYRFLNDAKLDLREFEGTASVLLPRLAAQLDPGQDRSRAWPVNASQLGNQLRRCAPILRRYGIEATPIRSHGERRWRLTRTAPDGRAKAASPAAPIRKPEQISIVCDDGEGAGKDKTASNPSYPPVTAMTAGAAGVTAGETASSPRQGDAGAGLDGAFSSFSGEREGDAEGQRDHAAPKGGNP